MLVSSQAKAEIEADFTQEGLNNGKHTHIYDVYVSKERHIDKYAYKISFIFLFVYVQYICLYLIVGTTILMIKRIYSVMDMDEIVSIKFSINFSLPLS